MTKKDITDVVRAFGQAGRRAKAAGYDLVEIHCAHGYLLSQFLSPLTNQRRDKYGGTLLKRMLLPLEVLEEVRSQVGEDFPVMVRLGLADNPPAKTLYPGGLPVEEGLVAARALEQAGSAILDLSAGICGSRPAGVSGEAYYLPFAQACSQAVKLPLICTGGVTLAQTAEHIVASGTAALVGVGRALAADRSWVEKARKELT